MIRLGKRLWVEDECLLHDPTVEHLDGAYLRLAGRVFRYEDAIRREDRGDHIVYEMPTGVIVVGSFDGASIYARPCPRRSRRHGKHESE